MEAYTFQPEISKLAQQIKASEAELGGGTTTAAYQRLYQRGCGASGAGAAKRQAGYGGLTTAVSWGASGFCCSCWSGLA